MTVIVGARPPAPPPTVTGLSIASRDAVARQLWDQHYAQLAGWCAALVGDRDAAHDIASEAFTRLLCQVGRRPRPARVPLRHGHEPGPRPVAARAARPPALRPPRGVTPTSAPASDPWLRDLVERLPDRMRVPVLLHYFADMSIDEVAAALHRPPGTIKRTLSDARHMLHSWLEDEHDQPASSAHRAARRRRPTRSTGCSPPREAAVGVAG